MSAAEITAKAEVIEEREDGGYDLIVTPLPGSITSNIAGLKEWVAKAAEPYQGRIVPEDQYRFAKKDLADLRKLQKMLEDERKRAKTVIMAPYSEFEQLYKEAKAPLDEAIAGIDRQVKEIEEREKTQRKTRLIAFIQEEAKAISGESLLVKMEKPEILAWFVDPKWLLSSATTTSVQLAVREKLTQVQRDFDCILKDAPAPAAIEAYERTGSLSAAFEAKRKADEIKAELARRSAAVAAAAPAPEPAPALEPSSPQPEGKDAPQPESGRGFLTAEEVGQGFTPTPGFILVKEPEKPEDPALLETAYIKAVLAFPRYKKAMVKEILNKSGVLILKDIPKKESN